MNYQPTARIFNLLSYIVSTSIQKLVAGIDIEIVIRYFFLRCKLDDIPLEYVFKRGISDIICGGLRELDHYLGNFLEIVVCGPTNAGKDLFLKLLFGEDILLKFDKVFLPDEEEKVALLEDEDVADKTRWITKLPLGDGESSGVVLVNSPGLYSDDPEEGHEDETRIVVGLPTLTGEIEEIGLIDAAKSPVKPERIPVEEIEQRFCAERRVLIYLVDLSMVPFGVLSQESIRADLQHLREVYGDRLVVCGSHSDILGSWQEKKRDNRRKIWERVLGEDLNMFEYSGVDEGRKGMLAILRAILTASGEDPSILWPCLQADLKKARFTFSLHQLTGLLTSVLINVDQNQPYSYIRAGITLVSSLYCLVYYRVTAEEFLESNGKIEKILTIAKDGITAQVESRERAPRGWGERLAKWWSRGRKRFYEEVCVYEIGNSAIADTCALVYSLIHALEEIPSPLISEIEVERFFRAYFEERNAEALLKEQSPRALQRVISEGLIAFFQEYHPQSLEFRTKLSR